MRARLRKVERWLGRRAGALLPTGMLEAVVARVWEQEPHLVLEPMGRHLRLRRSLANMPFDLPVQGRIEFEHLAGLFASTSLDHAVISMTVRQAAYLFGLIRQMKARTVIEIGRYKGGSTLLIAAALGGEGRLWSVDLGDKASRLHPGHAHGAFDRELLEVCRRFELTVELVVGNSRAVEVDTGPVDVVVIDGDHSYDGVRSDFERFGRRVRLGGAVLLDDAFDEELFRTHSDTVGRLVREVVASGEFRLVRAVDRLAHLERVRESVA